MKLIPTEQNNNSYRNFNPTDTMFLNQTDRKLEKRRKKNPCDRNDVQNRCLVCERIYHFAQNYPETKSQNTFFSQEIVLFETDYDHPAKLIHSFPVHPFYTLWKHQKTVRFSHVFRGVEKGCIRKEWGIRNECTNTWKWSYKWVQIFKSGPSKICGRKPLKNFKEYGLLKQTISLQIF